MEHSTAILEHTGKELEKGAARPSTIHPDRKSAMDERVEAGAERQDADGTDNHSRRNKRKREWPDHSIRQGGQGGRGGRKDGKRHKKGDMGRGEYFRNEPDKRQKTEDSRQRREDGSGPSYGVEFSKEEIDAEERRPKRKVAVMIGYSGTGYKGMQISPRERTVEGDLFTAFVAAGAISKANADDPKKASLVRCARTDKGVHAAGNMISLKLIVEDPNTVEKINSHLSPQIRVWGIERTIGSFSCYQACDSRWYEYLIPSYAFLPPHPSSYLAKQLEKLADKAGDMEGYESRQEEVQGFWERVDKDELQPIIYSIDEDIRHEVVKALHGEEEADAKAAKTDPDLLEPAMADKAGEGAAGNYNTMADASREKAAEAAIIINEPAVTHVPAAAREVTHGEAEPAAEAAPSTPNGEPSSTNLKPKDTRPLAPDLPPEEQDRVKRLRAATKRLRNAYIAAKRRYRIPSQRILRLQSALDSFVGTRNYHNYTVQKTFRDPSAKRNIKSFVVNKQPILTGDGPDEEKSEWLSLKVHGQSFMMHQIRKMVGMATLLVRCGSDIDATMTSSFSETKYSIPKVPGLGLLLERPVFDSYNRIQAVKHDREQLKFDKYEKAIEEFKHREIYGRIFREEEEKGEFGRFFNHVDNFREAYFLWVSSLGIRATDGVERLGIKAGVESEDEGGDGGDG